jgi:3-keto-L-gulonate-6-phosphate decarboxylase
MIKSCHHYLPSIASRHCLAASTGSVAGGIKPDTIKEIVAEEPDLVIVGGGIANADDPDFRIFNY